MVNNERLLSEFLQYVQIDSESNNEKEYADFMKKILIDLGGKVQTDNAGEKYGSNGYNIFALFEGTLAGDSIAFSAHLDTVKPGNGIKPVIRDGIVYSEGETILGSDDKAGIVAIIEAIRSVKEQKVAHRTFEVVLTIGEELALMGARNMDYSKFHSKRAVVLDVDGDVGGIAVGAPGHASFTAIITGKSAHAGMEPEVGISAIQVAGDAISKMKLLRIDHETTANIGSIKSEFGVNIVPEKCEILGEVRSRNKDKMKAQMEHISKTLQESCDKYGATLDCKWEVSYESFDFSETHPLINSLRNVYTDMGLKTVIKKASGGSDASAFNGHGIETVVLSMGMQRIHSTDEFIEIKQLELSAESIYRMMTRNEF